jgi:hypothetical protein
MNTAICFYHLTTYSINKYWLCHACSCSSSPWCSRAPGSPVLRTQATISTHTCLPPVLHVTDHWSHLESITCVITFPIVVCSQTLFPASGLMFVMCPCFLVCWRCSCCVLCLFLNKCLTPCTCFSCPASVLTDYADEVTLLTLPHKYLLCWWVR